VEQLRNYAARYGITLDDSMLAAFGKYQDFMLEYNQKVNLTAITAPEEILVKHFLDSLLVLDAYDIPHGARIIDVGTGAGFPGVPLKIARPDIDLTLLDSLNKRVTFLKDLFAGLVGDAAPGVPTDCIHDRAEQAAHKPLYRERFDVAASRAVAALPALCEYSLAFVRPGGVFIALKGGNVEKEAERAQSAIRLMGGEILEIKQYALPDGSARSIVCIKKISQTPPKYPRIAQKITKSPL
jgi:16S rRNA (guanine(527)-N(7))-methyltransferase RsmG